MNFEHPPLRWGILSTGRIASVFAKGIAASKCGRLVAVGSRTLEAAQVFAAAHGCSRAHGSYEALFADPEVEAVYIGTPHPQHAEWAVKAAQAGKHVLCEKPLGLNHAEGVAMVRAAREHAVLLMEAFMYRCHPQTLTVVELIRSGALGTVGLVQAAFSFKSDYDASSRLWKNEAGGGGIMDVGCYPMSMARLVAGAASGQPFLDPVSVTGAGVLHPESGVDVHAVATLKFPNDMIAQISCGVGLTQENVVRIYGTGGWLLVPSPWVINRDGGDSTLLLHKAGAAGPKEITIEAAPLYALEADTFADAVRAGLRDVPQMSTADTLGNLAALDQWRAAIGLVYQSEKTPTPTVRTSEDPGVARCFDHVDLRVADIAVAGPFYRALLPALGFTLEVEIEGWLQFEAPGTTATEFFGITEDPAHVANQTRIAFRAASSARVDELAALLPGLGAGAIEGPGFEADDYYAVYFEDPSGNWLEIVHRTRPFTSERAT
jgi:predicted dehydrogenase/catechol 2,3-dioxygenase-like lactoylglutathione lyase family enzyme